MMLRAAGAIAEDDPMESLYVLAAIAGSADSCVIPLSVSRRLSSLCPDERESLAKRAVQVLAPADTYAIVHLFSRQDDLPEGLEDILDVLPVMTPEQGSWMRDCKVSNPSPFKTVTHLSLFHITSRLSALSALPHLVGLLVCRSESEEQRRPDLLGLHLDLQQIGALPKLRSLELKGYQEVLTTEGKGGALNIQELVFPAGLSTLGGLTQLRRLCLHDRISVSGQHTLAPLRGLCRLRVLEIHPWFDCDYLWGLHRLTALRDVTVHPEGHQIDAGTLSTLRGKKFTSFNIPEAKMTERAAAVCKELV